MLLRMRPFIYSSEIIVTAVIDAGKIATGIRNPRKAVSYLQNRVDRLHPLYAVDAVSLAVTSRYPWGTHVLDRDWDVLVILDTSRVDAMEEVASEFEFVKQVDSIWSLGSSSVDWIAHTFDARYHSTLENTAYICSNPHGETVIDDRQLRSKHSTAARRFYRWGSWNPVRPQGLALFERLWQCEPPNDQQGPETTHVRPRVVTDRTIDIMRSNEFDRVIVHYMPPHYPWVSNAIREDRDLYEHEQRPDRIPETSREQVWNAYLDDLRWVLDDISLLLENIDADTVAISADHGDAFGEWGIYGHSPGRIHGKIRRVPWVETTATDHETYTPSTERVEAEDSRTQEQLEALGYR